jgi:hypothetical protein
VRSGLDLAGHHVAEHDLHRREQRAHSERDQEAEAVVAILSPRTSPTA